MQMNDILDFALPYTIEDHKCSLKKQKKNWQRERLRNMVEAYKHGEIVDFNGLHISVDIEEIIKRINN